MNSANLKLSKVINNWRNQPNEARRVVVFGSSNTELAYHNLGRFSWSCWLEVCLRSQVGKHVSLTNAGISGEVVLDLLKRVDRDVLPLRPHMVIITIGGNDRWQMPVTTYRQNLKELAGQLMSAGTLPVLQTYYSLLTEDENQPPEMFTPYMDANRELADELGIPCIDTYPLLHAWHLSDPAGYRSLMLDPGHLNPVGHAVFGTLCVRRFGLSGPDLPVDISRAVRSSLSMLKEIRHDS